MAERIETDAEIAERLASVLDEHVSWSDARWFRLWCAERGVDLRAEPTREEPEAGVGSDRAISGPEGAESVDAQGVDRGEREDGALWYCPECRATGPASEVCIIPDAEAVQGEREVCTPLTARWCPKCGQCTCDENHRNENTRCPLHGLTSTHAMDDAPTVQPTEPSEDGMNLAKASMSDPEAKTDRWMPSEEVVEALREAAMTWWEGNRPLDWDEAQHISMPAVNVTSEREKSLAYECAGYAARLRLTRDVEEGT